MTDEELKRALDGLIAWDHGAVSSGIHDEDLRARCIAALNERRDRGAAQWRGWLARLVREMWLSEEAIELGYGTEDAMGFAEWLDDVMGVPVPG